jgi:hypothetical protein
LIFPFTLDVRMNRLLFSAALISALFGALSTHAQTLPSNTPAPPPSPEVAARIAKIDDVPRLLAAAAKFERESRHNDQIAALQRVLELRPMAGNIQYELAAAYAQVNDKRHTYDMLLKMQMMGYAYDPSKDERFVKAQGTDAWEYIVLNLQANQKPFGPGKVALTLPKGDTLIESIAWDAKRKQFLAGSMREGAIYRVSADGKTLAPFIAADKDNQLRSVTAMQADNKRGHLWVAATGLPHFKYIDKNDYARTALYQFDLADGRLLRRIDMPAATGPHLFDNLHVAANGNVYVADSTQKRIHQVTADGTRLVVQNPKLTHVRGLTTSDDGKLLYFADTEFGVFVLEFSSGVVLPVQVPSTLTLFGVEGLYFWKGHLIAIQNAFPPSRVMRMKLDPTGTRVAASLPIDAGHEALEGPTRGFVDGDALFFIANSQKPKYDRFGLPIDEQKLAGVSIWESDLNFAIDKVLSTSQIEVKKGAGQ